MKWTFYSVGFLIGAIGQHINKVIYVFIWCLVGSFAVILIDYLDRRRNG